MDPVTKDVLAQLDNLLAASNQSWLFGAGISLDAGIPLMWPLTERVFTRARNEGEPTDINVLEFVKSQLSDDSHIEHILSQLGDHRAIADRSKDKTVEFGGVTLSIEGLDNLHQRILTWIAETIRWGYVPAKSGGTLEKIGTLVDRIVIIDHHAAFVSALFNRSQAGIAERRGAVRMFTTNYDTLLEDALALGGFSYWDGFSGGAVAYRSHRYGDDEPDLRARAHVIKLHGSIDWHLGEDDRVWRVRGCARRYGGVPALLAHGGKPRAGRLQRDARSRRHRGAGAAGWTGAHRRCGRALPVQRGITPQDRASNL
jgi:SIR2-like domain